MFNIVGFGLPESISERKKENLAEQYCLDHNYSQTFLSLNRFDVCNMEMTEFQHSNFSQQTLEGIHLRLVLKAEEEALGAAVKPLLGGEEWAHVVLERGVRRGGQTRWTCSYVHRRTDCRNSS